MINDKPYMLAEIVKSTPDTYTFKFKPVDGSKLDFSPGMFLMVTFLDTSTGEKISRAFSIASEPNADYVEFFIHMVHGQFTTKLENAKVGDIYYMSGPYGQFKFDEASDRKVIFIAGGTGIAPFISIMKYIKSRRLNVDIVLLYSIRRPEEELAKDSILSLEKEINLKTCITVTRPQPTDSWQGETGHINAYMIKKYAPDVAERTAYICGPVEFSRAMKDLLLGLGLQNERIKADVWG